MNFYIAVLLMAVVATSYAKRGGSGSHEKSEACEALKKCKTGAMMEQLGLNPAADMEIMGQAMACAKPCMEMAHGDKSGKSDTCRPDHSAIKQCMDDKGFPKPPRSASSEEEDSDSDSDSDSEKRGPGGRGRGRGGKGGKHGGPEKYLHMLPYANEMMDKFCPSKKDEVKSCLAGLNDARFNPDTYTQEKRNEMFAAMCSAPCDTEDQCQADMEARKAEHEAKKAEREANRPADSEADRAARKAAMCECATANTPQDAQCPTPRPCLPEEDGEREPKPDKFAVMKEKCDAGVAPTFEEMMKHKMGGRKGRKHGRGGRHH